MKFDTPATTNPIDQLKVIGQPDRPHRRSAQDDGHGAPTPTNGTTWSRTRPTATSSAPRSPRAGSRRWILAAAKAAPGVIAIVTARERRQARQGQVQHRASCSAAPRSSTITRPSRVVVAETFEQARAAAELVRVDYDASRGIVRSGGRRGTAPSRARQRRRQAGNRGRRFRMAPSPPRRCSSTRPTPRPTRPTR